ncbi:carbonic anhydrase family protein [Flavobacterium sp. LB3R33]|uniref:carbonic anhydrase family protein n=1 Tax=Flavobacterium sp. LB3R33 TaxID=3401721 RepID=UPI003AAF3C2B
MIKNLFKVTVIVITFQMFSSCYTTTKNVRTQKEATSSVDVYRQRHVMTKTEQDSLTPEQVLAEFKDGNRRFNTGNITKREHSEEVRKAVTGGQFPKAIVLSCVDSRVPVEDVFDQGLGDVFVGRVAGNFVNTDLLGSMEFACKVSGAKLIIVMGHQHCGAIKGAIDDVHLGNITAMLSNIKPAIAMSQNFEGEKSSKNEAYVKTVNKNNILYAVSEIRTKSEILKEMENKGQIKIVGGYYSLLTGKLEFLN